MLLLKLRILSYRLKLCKNLARNSITALIFQIFNSLESIFRSLCRATVKYTNWHEIDSQVVQREKVCENHAICTSKNKQVIFHIYNLSNRRISNPFKEKVQSTIFTFKRNNSRVTFSARLRFF